jgi:hypothetical protein
MPIHPCHPLHVSMSIYVLRAHHSPYRLYILPVSYAPFPKVLVFRLLHRDFHLLMLNESRTHHWQCEFIQQVPLFKISALIFLLTHYYLQHRSLLCSPIRVCNMIETSNHLSSMWSHCPTRMLIHLSWSPYLAPNPKCYHRCFRNWYCSLTRKMYLSSKYEHPLRVFALSLCTQTWYCISGIAFCKPLIAHYNSFAAHSDISGRILSCTSEVSSLAVHGFRNFLCEISCTFEVSDQILSNSIGSETLSSSVIFLAPHTATAHVVLQRSQSSQLRVLLGDPLLRSLDPPSAGQSIWDAEWSGHQAWAQQGCALGLGLIITLFARSKTLLVGGLPLPSLSKR